MAAAAALNTGYAVTVGRRERVSATLPFQEHWLPLSNLDLLLPPVDVGVFFCYMKPPPSGHTTFPAVVSALKASLAQALVIYYPFAGEVVTSSAGEPELLCNNRGVDFIEAHADVELAELCLYDPDESVEGKLVPKKKEGVLCVQVTELRCGSLVLGCTFDHRVADGYSANMFFMAWAETAQAKPISAMPSFRRSLLSPRRPGCPDPIYDRLFVLISALPPPRPPSSSSEEEAVNRIYYVVADDIEKMQRAASANRSSSKLEAFSAYLWQIIGRGARPHADLCKMGIVVDGRSRLGKASCSSGESMDNYFGNVLSVPYGALGVEDLDAMGLSDVADTVHEFLREAVTGEHFQGLIDWVEGQRPKPAMARIYSEGGGRTTAFVVSSGQRFPMRKVDFGWGKPAFGSYHFPLETSAGYVMPMPAPRGNGDWIIYMHLARTLVEALEGEAGEIFRRLTPKHLDMVGPVPTTAAAAAAASATTEASPHPREHAHPSAMCL